MHTSYLQRCSIHDNQVNDFSDWVDTTVLCCLLWTKGSSLPINTNCIELKKSYLGFKINKKMNANQEDWIKIHHTHTPHTHTHTHTLTHSHPHTHTHTHTHSHIHTHTHTYTLTHTLTRAHSYSYTLTHTLTLTHIHTRTLTHTCTPHTHTHTHTLQATSQYTVNIKILNIKLSLTLCAMISHLSQLHPVRLPCSPLIFVSDLPVCHLRNSNNQTTFKRQNFWLVFDRNLVRVSAETKTWTPSKSSVVSTNSSRWPQC